MSRPLLVCYDGSEGARTALDAAAPLFAPHEAVVACYWQPFGESPTRFGIELLELVQDADSINEREEALAWQVAEEGAALAREAGLDAEPLARRIDTPVNEAILLHADELDAVAIVLGSRKKTTVRSLLLGDTANEIVQRAARPVFVAPSERLAERRRDTLAPDATATPERGEV